MTTFTNPSKNSTTHSNPNKLGESGFLLKEDGDFLLKEDGDKIILEQVIEFSNPSKNSTSFTNPSKN